MRSVALLALLVGTLAGCGFSLEDKDGCVSSSDCLGDRICFAGTCRDHGCDELCIRTCEASVECGAVIDDCLGACAGQRPSSLELVPRDPAVCKADWDVYESATCEVVACRLECDVLCSRGAECGHVADEMACRLGCWLDNESTCDPQQVSAASCEDLRVEARCAEARAQQGASFECDMLPCRDDYDCDPTEACEYGACRQRCLDDDECPDAECFLDACTDPVGTPCEPFSSLGACGGASCINVDAANQTTSHYCTRSCFDWKPCPSGFSCVDNRCRR